MVGFLPPSGLLSLLVLSLAGFCMAGIAIYSQFRVQKLTVNLKILQQENASLSVLLRESPQAWCSWRIGSPEVDCSTKLISLLGLENEQPVLWESITRIGGDSQFNPLRKAIQHLIEHGGEFSLQIHIPYLKKEFQIKGKCTDEKELQGYLSDLEFAFNRIILTLDDVTISVDTQKSTVDQLQDVLQEKEILQTLADISPLALWYRSPVGKIQYCNLAYAGALETTTDHVMAENCELVESHHPNSPYDLACQAIEKGEKVTERLHVVIGGSRRLLEITTVPIPETGATAGYAIDVTDLEESEAELAAHTNAHHEVLHQLSTPIAVFDEDTRLQFFNNAYMKLFKFDESWIYNKPTLGEILEDLRSRRILAEQRDFPAFKRERLDLFKTLLQPLHEWTHQPNGKTLRLMISPYSTGGLLFLFDDVTDKLALERGYNTLVAVQKETLDHLYEGIIVLGSDNRLRLTNPAMGRIWQIPEDEHNLGRPITELFSMVQHLFDEKNDLNILRHQLMSVLSSRQPTSRILELKNNIMIECSYVPLPDGSHLLGFVDVSDRWKLEQGLKERTETLERTDKLKTDFISHVSYELRTPLNTIAGFIEILLNQYFGSLNEKQLDYCRGIEESSHRLMGLINDMLDLANIEAGKLTLQLQEVNIESFLNGAIRLVHNRSYDQGLEIILENNTKLQTFQGDERRLKHALFNLLSNAIKFTSSGGKVTVSAQHVDNNLHIAVSDTGIGISIEDQTKIFSLFEKGESGKKPQMMGAGLGLPLVKSLIELHNGAIEIESMVEIGTKITCILPLQHPCDSI